MPTLNEWARDTVKQMRQTLAPEARLWDITDPSRDLRAIVEQALSDIGHPNPNGNAGREVRDLVLHRIIVQFAPGYRNRRRVERDLIPHQLNVSLQRASCFFIDEIGLGHSGEPVGGGDDDDAE